MSRKKPENQFDYIEFSANDIERTKAFYAHVFGWRFEDYGPDYTAYFDGRLAGGFTKEVQPTGRGPLPVIYASDLAAAIRRSKPRAERSSRISFHFRVAADSILPIRTATNSRCGRTSIRSAAEHDAEPGLRRQRSQAIGITRF